MQWDYVILQSVEASKEWCCLRGFRKGQTLQSPGRWHKCHSLTGTHSWCEADPCLCCFCSNPRGALFFLKAKIQANTHTHTQERAKNSELHVPWRQAIHFTMSIHLYLEAWSFLGRLLVVFISVCQYLLNLQEDLSAHSLCPGGVWERGTRIRWFLL